MSYLRHSSKSTVRIKANKDGGEISLDVRTLARAICGLKAHSIKYDNSLSDVRRKCVANSGGINNLSDREHIRLMTRASDREFSLDEALTFLREENFMWINQLHVMEEERKAEQGLCIGDSHDQER